MKKNLYLWAIFIAFSLFTSACCKEVFVPSKEYITQKVSVDAFDAIEAHSAIKVVYTQVSTHQSIEVYAPDNMMKYIEVKVKDNTLVASLNFPKMGFLINGDYTAEVRVTAPAVHKVTATSAGEIILERGLRNPNPVSLEATSAAQIKSGKITTQELTLLATSSGSITVKNVHSQGFKAESNSAGKVEIMEMSSEVVEAEANSAGKVELKGKCMRATLNASSAGNVNAAELTAGHVIAEAGSAGNVFCHADESLKAKASSAGNVKYKGEPKDLSIPEKGGVQRME